MMIIVELLGMLLMGLGFGVLLGAFGVMAMGWFEKRKCDCSISEA